MEVVVNNPVPLSPHDERYGGNNGFFALGAASGEGRTIDQVADGEAHHKLRPYGSNPQIIMKIEVSGQEGRLILPATDQPPEMENQAAVVIQSPTPIGVGGDSYHYILLYADRQHIEDISRSLRFTVSNEPQTAGAAAIKLHFTAVPVETLPAGLPQKGWEERKAVPLDDESGQGKVMVRLYMQPGLERQGEVRAFLEAGGDTYNLGIAGSYGLDGMSVVNTYANIDRLDGTVWFEAGKWVADKPCEPHYYQYKDGKLLELPLPPVDRKR